MVLTIALVVLNRFFVQSIFFVEISMSRTSLFAEVRAVGVPSGGIPLVVTVGSPVGFPLDDSSSVLLTLLSPSAAAAAVGLVVTLDVPLLCAEQSLLQHLPSALAGGPCCSS
jgi:hypothetical protein